MKNLTELFTGEERLELFKLSTAATAVFDRLKKNGENGSIDNKFTERIQQIKIMEINLTKCSIVPEARVFEKSQSYCMPKFQPISLSRFLSLFLYTNVLQNCV